MDPGQLHLPYPGSGDRFPQWSMQETRELLMIRAGLDPTFMETKRNKILWEEIATRMRDKGYVRSADQCKSKWKNLVTRYKACETAEAEEMRQQFPYYTDLQSIFVARMQRMLWLEAEGGGAATATPTAASTKKKAVQQFSSDEEEENEDSEGGGNERPGTKRKKGMTTNVETIMRGIRGVVEEFTRQQMEMEKRWMRAYEAREEERRAKERDWRMTMEGLEKERMMMERKWREREEERRVREEARADKRDALITALLNKLRREE